MVARPPLASAVLPILLLAAPPESAAAPPESAAAPPESAAAPPESAAAPAELRLNVAVEVALPDVAVAVQGADVDGDGRVDLALVTAGGDVYVALNPGGELASWSWELVATLPLVLDADVYSGLEAADVDGDGLVDLLLYGDGAAPGTCAIAVLESLGDGAFAPGASAAVVPPVADDVVFGCTGAELADLDGDGALDIAVGFAYQPIDWFNGLLGAVNVFLGMGGGELAAPVIYPLAEDPAPFVSFAMTSGDFDGDGLEDLGFGSEVRYLSGPLAWRVETLQGEAGGRFRPGTVRAFDCVWCELQLARAADFDGDGRDDLLLAPTNPESYPSDYPVLLFGSASDGTFRAPEALWVEAGAVGLEASDVNADGLADVLLLGDGDHVTLLAGRGDGGFAAPRRFVTGRRIEAGTLADLDGDGASDLVTLSADPGAALELARGAAGGFALPLVSSAPSGAPELLAPPADFDGDGYVDVLAIGYGALDLLLGTGDGRFTLAASTPTTENAWPMPVADLDADGRLDLVRAAGEGFAVSRGLADGTFAPTPSAGERSIAQAALGDVDGDGHLDLVASEWPGASVDVYLGDGALGFTRVASLPVGVEVGGLLLADLSSDGALDLVAGARGSRGDPLAPLASSLASSLWLGDGRGGFSAAGAIEVSGSQFRAADLDADGALDVLGTDAVAFGDGAGHFSLPAPLPSAGAWQLELADLDGDGLSDLVYQQAEGVMVARGAPGGAFEPARRLTGASGWLSFAVAQLAGSAAPDLVALHTATAEDSQRLELLVAENVTPQPAPPACASR